MNRLYVLIAPMASFPGCTLKRPSALALRDSNVQLLQCTGELVA